MPTYPQRPSVEPTTAREARMLTGLLAGCDPCGFVEKGGSPNLYAGMALDALGRLHRGTDTVDMLNVFPGDVAVESAMSFIRVSMDWWDTARAVRSDSFQQVAAAFG